VPTVPYAQPLATGLATLAWTRQAGGDPSGALDAMGEAERAMPGPAVGLINPVPAPRARLLLAQGEVAAAARWIQEHGLGPDDEPVYPREPEYLALARVLLAQDRPGPALALLERLHAAAAAQDRAGSIIEIQALRALALTAAGQEARAVDVLAAALTLACPQCYVRVFADEGPPMGAAGPAGRSPQGRPGRRPRRRTRLPGPGAAGVRRQGRRARRRARRRAGAGPGRAARIAGELVVTLDTVKSMSATCWASSARPTAPRPSPAPASSA
jgi:LuxR family transcriptional regulator, maltose regulon positive regulatory protein